jgi:peptidoglycan LD-endopeptidase CwlK
MAVDLSVLEPAFQRRALELLEACRSRGIEMRPYCAVRSPLQQAALWRQGRAREEIQRKIESLREGGAPYLAECISRAGPQHGRKVTNAAPGLSWHQWGEALDCFWVVDGEASWSTTRDVDGRNGYKVYTEEARLLGLTAGGKWALADWPHVQFRRADSPLGEMVIKEIDAEMRRRYTME